MSGSINPYVGQVIYPRFRALVGGAVINGLKSVEIDSNNYGRGDSFHFDAVPDVGSHWFDPPDNAAPVDVLIQGAMLSGPAATATGWTTIVQGGADSVDWDPIRRTVSIQGRDYSSKLIELSTGVDVYLNRVSSDVISDLATRAGLKCDADRTSTIVGQYYQIEHKRHGLASHSKQTTAWDLMMRLARIERYDLWVTGTTVSFKRQLSNTDPAWLLPISLGGDVPVSPVWNLRLGKQAGLTREVRVEVLSWDSRQRRATVGKFPPAGSVLKAAASAQTYTFVLPNLTQDRVNAEAAAYYNEIKCHQRTITWEQTGNMLLQPRQRVAISGAGLNWDGIYRIDSVHRRYSNQGFEMTVTVRNRDLVAADIDGSGLDA